MIELLLGWIARYPIVSIEDPLAEDDEAGLIAFTGRPARSCRSSATITSSPMPRAFAGAKPVGACNAALIKPNQAGTVDRDQGRARRRRAGGWGAIVSARSGESEDVSIVHLAVGWGVEQLKVGSFSPLRAHGQMERGPAHRRGDRRAMLPPRLGVPRGAPDPPPQRGGGAASGGGGPLRREWLRANLLVVPARPPPPAASSPPSPAW